MRAVPTGSVDLGFSERAGWSLQLQSTDRSKREALARWPLTSRLAWQGGAKTNGAGHYGAFWKPPGVVSSAATAGTPRGCVAPHASPSPCCVAAQR
jgi:hypothetical protein